MSVEQPNASACKARERHDPNDYGHGRPLSVLAKPGSLVCHREFGLGHLIVIHDDDPAPLATVCFSDAVRHVVDCPLEDLTAGFVALSTIWVEDESNVGPRYAPPGELVTFELNTWKGSFHGEPTYDVIFHPSGVWWNGVKLDEIRNEMPFVEVFMSEADLVSARRSIPDVRRPEIRALRTVMLDVVYDYIDTMTARGNIEVPPEKIKDLEQACATAGIGLSDFVETRKNGRLKTRIKVDEIDAFAAHLGMGERLLEKNQLAMAASCKAVGDPEAPEPPSPF